MGALKKKKGLVYPVHSMAMPEALPMALAMALAVRRRGGGKVHSSIREMSKGAPKTKIKKHESKT